MKEKKFIKLTPFKMQVLQSFPFIDADFDAITNYELLCKVVDYLNKTVENVDYLNDTVNDYIDKFNELKSYVDNYFDNLDVQEEINNKLDEMAESGELTDIIAQYLGLAGVLSYETVSDLKSATNLVNGSTARTLGYYTLNDGGTALYKIRTITNDDVVDEKFIISLYDNNLVAELIIINNTINVLSIGCKKNDDTFNSTSYIQAIINKNKGYKIYLPAGSYYVTNINIPVGYHNVKIYGDNDIGEHRTLIKPYSGMSGTMFTVGLANTTPENIIYGFELHNLQIKGGSTKYGIDLGRTSNVIFDQVSLTYIDGFALRLDGCYDSKFDSVEINNAGNNNYAGLIMQGTITATNAVRFNNSRIEACTRYLHTKANIFQLMFNNTKFEDNEYTDSTYPIVIDYNGDITFNNCLFTSKKNPTEYFINFLDNVVNVTTRFIGCNFQCSGTNTGGGKYIKCPDKGCQDIVLDSCHFYFPNTNGAIYLNKATFINNSIFPHSFTDSENTYIIDIKDYVIMKNNMFLGNTAGSYVPFGINLIGSNNKISDNIFSNWNISKLIDGISTYPNNNIDTRLKQFTASSITNGVVDALQSSVIQIPSNTTINSIINASIGSELTFYSNGANVVLDFTGIPLVYNYITSLTIPAGRTATLKKVDNTHWLLVSSNT